MPQLGVGGLDLVALCVWRGAAQEDVEKSIPKKEETIIDVELTLLQKQYYRAVFERNREFLCRPTAADGKMKGPKLLNLESQLRKCCNHPFLLEGAAPCPCPVLLCAPCCVPRRLPMCVQR